MGFPGMDLEGRVAIVTGGSRGIGRAVVEALAEAGTHIVVNYARDEQAAGEAVEAARGRGVRALASKADVASLKESEALVRRTIEEFGRLDFLICNAGIWNGAPVEEMSEELWDSSLEINLKGSWTVCRAAVPELKRRGFGRLVLVSSTAGQRGEANYANYAAAKGGQIALTKSLASELAADGITVNAVAPGWVATEMTAGVLLQPETRREIERGIPLGRVASPEDIARPIIFLCSAWARHITGEVLNINGGSVLCG